MLNLMFVEKAEEDQKEIELLEQKILKLQMSHGLSVENIKDNNDLVCTNVTDR
jgi:hypothetical protein